MRNKTQPERVQDLLTNNLRMVIHNNSYGVQTYHGLFGGELCQELFSRVRQTMAQYYGDDYTMGIPNILVTDLPVYQMCHPSVLTNQYHPYMKAVVSKVYDGMESLIASYVNFLINDHLNKEIVIYTIEMFRNNEGVEHLLVRDNRIDWDNPNPLYTSRHKEFIKFHVKKHKFCGDF